jgi:ketosteroid isomerase-like protein
MLRFLFLAVLGTTASVAHAQTAETSRCAVWQRELSFAASVERHDEKAFAEHIESDAVFAANTARPQRGRAAIVKQWKSLLEGKSVRVRWYPAWVVQAGDPSTVLSSGPALLENLAPNANPRYTLIAFSTVWHRGSDGGWRVMSMAATKAARRQRRTWRISKRDAARNARLISYRSRPCIDHEISLTIMET